MTIQGVVPIAGRLARAMLVGSVFACVAPTAPKAEIEATWRPPLGIGEPHLGRLRNGGVLLIPFQPEDWTFELATNEYLSANVSALSGDVELLRIRREICFRRTGEVLVCRMFSVTMNGGHDVRDLEALLLADSANLSLIGGSGSFGSFYAFGSLSTSRKKAESYAGVNYTDLVYPLSIGAPGPPFRSRLVGTLPFFHGAAEPGDGRLTAFPGDTVMVTYTPTSGAAVSVSVVVPAGLP